jgi:hypothetical protein
MKKIKEHIVSAVRIARSVHEKNAQMRAEASSEIKQAKKQKNRHFENAVLQWLAPQYIQYAKGPVWFAIFTLTIATLLGYAIVAHQYTFAAAVTTFAAVYTLAYRQKPDLIEVKLSKVGIKIGQHVYPYDEIQAFWIIDHPSFLQTLNIRLARKFLPDIEVYISSVDPQEIRNMLQYHLSEWQGRKETLSESLIRACRL